MNSPSKLLILIVNQAGLDTHGLAPFVQHCQNAEELNAALIEKKNCIRIVACTSNDIDDVALVLKIHQINTLFLYDLGTGPIEYAEPWCHLTTKVVSDQKLLVSLCTKAASCLYAEAAQHRQNENYGLADLCKQDIIRILKYSTTLF